MAYSTIIMASFTLHFPGSKPLRKCSIIARIIPKNKKKQIQYNEADCNWYKWGESHLIFRSIRRRSDDQLPTEYFVKTDIPVNDIIYIYHHESGVFVTRNAIYKLRDSELLHRNIPDSEFDNCRFIGTHMNKSFWSCHYKRPQTIDDPIMGYLYEVDAPMEKIADLPEEITFLPNYEVNTYCGSEFTYKKGTWMCEIVGDDIYIRSSQIERDFQYEVSPRKMGIARRRVFGWWWVNITSGDVSKFENVVSVNTMGRYVASRMSIFHIVDPDLPIETDDIMFRFEGNFHQLFEHEWEDIQKQSINEIVSVSADQLRYEDVSKMLARYSDHPRYAQMAEHYEGQRNLARMLQSNSIDGNFSNKPWPEPRRYIQIFAANAGAGVMDDIDEIEDVEDIDVEDIDVEDIMPELVGEDDEDTDYIDVLNEHHEISNLIRLSGASDELRARFHVVRRRLIEMQIDNRIDRTDKIQRALLDVHGDDSNMTDIDRYMENTMWQKILG